MVIRTPLGQSRSVLAYEGQLRVSDRYCLHTYVSTRYCLHGSELRYLVVRMVEMYVSSLGVRRRSTHKILYMEGSSAIVSEPHVSWKEECVARTIKIEVRVERKPVSVQKQKGKGPT